MLGDNIFSCHGLGAVRMCCDIAWSSALIYIVALDLRETIRMMYGCVDDKWIVSSLLDRYLMAERP